MTGYRVRQNPSGDFVDIYLYDSLSSGAGYAVSMESSIPRLLTRTRELLEACTCDSACHKCLKYYRNQFIHGLLDRKAALDLLTWGENGTRAAPLPKARQREMISTFRQIFELSDIKMQWSENAITVTGANSSKEIVVYPAMWVKPVKENAIYISDMMLRYEKPHALKEISDCL